MQQDGDVARSAVNRGEVDIQIAIEVAGQDQLRAGRHGEVDAGAETADTVVAQDRHTVAAAVGGDEVQVQIAVDIGENHGNRAAADQNIQARQEHTGTNAQGDGDGVGG